MTRPDMSIKVARVEQGPKRSGEVGVRSTEQSVGIKVGGF